MKYFLVQPNNSLVHLPDCRIEIGQRDAVEITQIGHPSLFMPGRKRPDLCIFTRPPGTHIGASCRVVEDSGIIHTILASPTEIGANQYIVLGIIEDTDDMSGNVDAMEVIQQAVRDIKPY